MRRPLSLIAALVACALVAPAADVRATEVARPRSAREATTGEVLVKYRSTAIGWVARKLVGGEVVDRLPEAGLEVLDPAAPVGEAIDALADDPNVAWAEPNYLYEIDADVIPNDPRYSDLWALEQIGMPAAWASTRGSPEVTVAVVDSGIAMNHPDLTQNIWRNPGETGEGRETNGVDDDGNGYVDDWRGWDWVEDDNRPGDLHGHGSHVAGTIGARGNDEFGIAGINWEVGIMPLRGLDPTGTGTSADIAEAFRYATAMGAEVVNASFGGTGHSLAILDAITAAPDTLFIVAAGNDSQNNDLQPQYPCNYRLANLICVAASDRFDNLASFSNYGVVSVDLAAPGVGILSAAPSVSTVFGDDFETDISTRWTKGGSKNLWTRAIDAQGGYLSDSPSLPYLNDTDAWVATSEPFSLANEEDCTLHFSLRLDLEENDVLYAEMSRDAVSWSRLEAWTGSSGGRWRQATAGAQGFDGSESAFLRFRVRSDSSATGQGADIDDLRIRCQATDYTGSEFLSASGTSMAAPHVAGVAALLKAARPSATMAEITSAILASVDTSIGLAGRVSSSGRLNAANALGTMSSTGTEDPSPGPSPEPEPIPGAATEHARTISMGLSRALRVAGRVRTAGDATCISSVPVRIKRNGKVIRRITTDETGYYRVQLRDRPGRYIAVAPRVQVSELPSVTCLRAVSAARSL